MTEVNPDIGEILLTEDDIQTKVALLGKQISEDYRDDDLLLVGVLKGAFVMMADIARSISVPAEFDFMAVSSYGSTTKTSGIVRIIKDLDLDISGRRVLIVEDIVDSGLTLSYLLRNLSQRRPRSIEVCALMTKPEVQQVQLDIRYHGFAIPPVFVVGYGLDYRQRYRNLPYVGTLKPHVYAAEEGVWPGPSVRP
ncbi:MAG: hypoxanthine phosphoribosyltransferase [Actinomycetota bacterium]|nr:hypoxanthine phosphoribosyltransferase [Actinomycetota bacterium]